MYDDDDQMTASPELRELRDSLSGVATPEQPPLEAITARGRARRRQRLTNLTRLSVAGVAAATALALGVSGAFTPAAKLGTIRTAAYTLRHNQNGTDTLTLKPGELLDPAQLQSDFAKYGIRAKVTTGAYCTSNPEPAGFSRAVTGPGSGASQEGSGQQAQERSGQQPPGITIDPTQIPAGTELTVGDFQLTSGQFAGEKQANFSLMNSSSYTCTSSPPDMSQPDTSPRDIGVLYGGPAPSGS
jgi:hypothetical protein